MGEAFINKPSVFDNSPGKATITNILQGKKVHRKLTIGVTDASNVSKVTYDGDLLTQEELIDAVMASTAMPFIFPYVNHNNQILMDGGVLLNLDIASAIRRCLEVVDDEANIIIDTIMVSTLIHFI